MEKKKLTCRKQFNCNVFGCDKPHRRNGYCANHSQQYKRNTLGIYPHSKLCTVDRCFRKHFCKGMCLRHYGAIRSANYKKVDNDMVANAFKAGTDINKLYSSSHMVKLAMKKAFGDKCANCGWDEASCDGHHMIPLKKGGLNLLTNIIILCPNCHRLAHNDILTIEHLQNIHPTSVEPKEIAQ